MQKNKISIQWMVLYLVMCSGFFVQNAVAMSNRKDHLGFNEEFRPPAVPLVTCDPYFSVWSFDDNLYEGETKHWTGTEHRMSGAIQIDGQSYRFIGLTDSGLASMLQQSLALYATRTVYVFRKNGVELTVTFFFWRELVN